MKHEHPGVITLKYGFISILLLLGTLSVFVMGGMALEAKSNEEVSMLMLNTPLLISKFIFENSLAVFGGLAGLSWVFYSYGTLAGNLISILHGKEVLIGRITIFLICTTIYTAAALVHVIALPAGWSFAGFWYAFAEKLSNWAGFYTSVTLISCFAAGHLLGSKIKNNVLHLG